MFLDGCQSGCLPQFSVTFKKTQYYDTSPHDVSLSQSVYALYVAITNLMLIMGLNYEVLVYFEG